ncbi:MAG TPA: acyl-ACP--UDP-N-acetylglucosamine O-acyltransferase [bacterium]
MNRVHETAVIGKGVSLGDGNDIGPGCMLEDGVVLGSGNRLWMNVYIGPGTTMGDENQVHMGAVVGHQPQDLAYTGADTFTRIGHRNTIREYVTIHRGTKDGTATEIGDDNFFMANAHIAHNCRIGSKVILVNLASLTGHCVIGDQAFISGIVGLHQFTRIGRLAMISALSAVNKDVPPFMLCGGRPAVVQGVNVVGLRRAGFPLPVREEIRRAHRILYREGSSIGTAVEELENSLQSPESREILEFVKSSTRGICGGIGSDPSESEDSILPRRRHASAE